MKALLALPALLVLAAPAIAAPTPAPPAPPATAVPAPPTADQVEAARQAIAGVDISHLLQDRDYAATMLGHVELLTPLAAANPDATLALDNLRLFALISLHRQAEVGPVIDRMVGQAPRQAGFYAGPWYGALAIEDSDRALAVVEAASRNVPGVGWGQLYPIFERRMVGPLLGRFATGNEEPKRVRLAQALFRIGWPGNDDHATSDYLRSILVADRVRVHDNDGAAGFAASITTPDFLLPMLLETRYDRLLAPGEDRLAVLRRALADDDRETQASLAVNPQDQRRVADRVRYLRAVARDADALALLQPFLADIPATVRAGEFGMWLVNDAAYALIALGRDGEAIALMARLGQLPAEANPELIGPAINRGEMLWRAGRFEEALAFDRALAAGDARFASDFGKAWIAADTVCALAGLHREAEAAPEMARLRGWDQLNTPALVRGHLCLGESDEAARLFVRELDSDKPEAELAALQDFELGHGNAQTGPYYDRLRALRDRPDVHAALGRVGRVLSLPVARSSIGGEY